MEIGDMRERISSIDVGVLIDDSINETKVHLIDFIQSQIAHGYRKDGRGIAKYSTSKTGKYYVNEKYDLGLFEFDSPPFWDLTYTGDFLLSIKAVISGEFIIIDSNDNKVGYINSTLARKGEDNLDTVYELNSEDLFKYAREYFYPVFLRKFRAKLDL